MSETGWARRITDDGEELLTFKRDGAELASVNVEPYDDEYVVLFGDGDTEVDYERMQMFASLGDAQAYIITELGL